MLNNYSVFSDNYFSLIKNLPIEDKKDLIIKITESIYNEDKIFQDRFFSCYGKFDDERSAEDIISDIRKSRHFVEKNLEF